VAAFFNCVNQLVETIKIKGLTRQLLDENVEGNLCEFFHTLFCALTNLNYNSFVSVYLTRVRGEDCGQEELARCAKPLQVLSTSELTINITRKDELDKLCPYVERILLKF
jgi:hypothetical protein